MLPIYLKKTHKISTIKTKRQEEYFVETNLLQLLPLNDNIKHFQELKCSIKHTSINKDLHTRCQYISSLIKSIWQTQDSDP